jgi:hypothetical protein
MVRLFFVSRFSTLPAACWGGVWKAVKMAVVRNFEKWNFSNSGLAEKLFKTSGNQPAVDEHASDIWVLLPFIPRKVERFNRGFAEVWLQQVESLNGNGWSNVVDLCSVTFQKKTTLFRENVEAVIWIYGW